MRKNIFLILPLFAVAALIGFSLSKTTPVGAQQDPKQARIEVLTQKLKDAVADAQKNGEFYIDEQHGGERLYAGETAKKIKALEKEVGNEIRELKARPAEERAKTIAAVNAFNDKYLYKVPEQPKQVVQYGGRVGNVQGTKTGSTESYYSQDYAYVVDYQTGKVLDVTIRAHEVGEPDWFIDLTPRYTKAQLEQMAVDFIAEQKLGVDLATLKVDHSQKIGTFFFNWYGEGGKHLQVGFAQGGQLISYTNAGFYEGL